MVTPSIVIVPRFGDPFGASAANVSEASGEPALAYQTEEGHGIILVSEIASIYVGSVPGRRADKDWWKAIPDIPQHLRERIENETLSSIVVRTEDGKLVSMSWNGASRFAGVDVAHFDDFSAKLARLNAVPSKTPRNPGEDFQCVRVAGLYWRLGNPVPQIVVERLFHPPLSNYARCLPVVNDSALGSIQPTDEIVTAGGVSTWSGNTGYCVIPDCNFRPDSMGIDCDRAPKGYQCLVWRCEAFSACVVGLIGEWLLLERIDVPPPALIDYTKVSPRLPIPDEPVDGGLGCCCCKAHLQVGTGQLKGPEDVIDPRDAGPGTGPQSP